MPPAASLFERMLGAGYARLPAAIRDVHDQRARKLLSGRCRITRGSGVLAQLLAWVMSLPTASEDVQVSVTIISDDHGEIWMREFAGKPMRSALRERDGCLEEALGPARFRFVLRADDQSILWMLTGVRILTVPLPLSWFAKVAARESAPSGRYTFDVRAELPVAGLLVHYQGWLSTA